MNNNAIAFTALCREYCSALENAAVTPPSKFVSGMLRLLPRIYICASDLKPDTQSVSPDDDGWLNSALTEDEYEEIRSRVAAVMGADDVYLEVFEEDMKYSDTPVAASVSENLADIYQQLFDFIDTVRFATDEVNDVAIKAVTDSFREFWSQTLCNVLRALNRIWTGDDSWERDDVEPETDDVEGGESLD